MTMISFAIFFACVGRASAGALTSVTVARTGPLIAGVKPASITVGATAATEIPADGTFTISSDVAVFVASQTAIAVTVAPACSGAVGATDASSPPNLVVTLPAASGCTIAAGAFTVAIAVETAIAVNPDAAVTVSAVSSVDTILAATAYTALAPLTSVVGPAANTCLNTGETPGTTFAASTANDDGAALAKDDTIKIAASSGIIFVASATIPATAIELLTGFTTCTATGAIDASSVLTLTLAGASCAVAKNTPFSVRIAAGYFTIPAADFTVTMQAKGSVAAGSANTIVNTAVTEVSTLVNNQVNAEKSTSVKYRFKAKAALATGDTITINAIDEGGTDLVAFAVVSTAETAAATVQAGASTVADVSCTTSAVSTASQLVVTLVGSSCAITIAHYVEVVVTSQTILAVNVASKGLAAKIATTGAVGPSCGIPLEDTFMTSGTKATAKSMALSADGTSFIGGATTSATGALAANGQIMFLVTDGLFKDQTTATAVTLTGGTLCAAKAESRASVVHEMQTVSALFVTLEDSSSTCAIALSTAFTVTATETSFLAARPTTASTKAGLMATTSDSAFAEGATAVMAIVHMPVATETPTTNTSNSSNSTTTGLMMDDAPRLQGNALLSAFFAFLLAAAAI